MTSRALAYRKEHLEFTPPSTGTARENCLETLLQTVCTTSAKTHSWGYFLPEFSDKVLLLLTGAREGERKTIDDQRFRIDPFTVKITPQSPPDISRFLLSH
ncbi:MAG: hypothetical protein KJT03_16465 [Verrucomicrobiae bacterium]|nr:hypothetical protein [Verrucomicrobiae bacterium]